MPAVAPVMFSVAVVALLYTPPLVILLKDVPPLVLTCHWYVMAVPVPLQVNDVLPAGHMVTSIGLAVTAGFAFTVNVASLVVADGGHEPVSTALYL